MDNLLEMELFALGGTVSDTPVEFYRQDVLPQPVYVRKDDIVYVDGNNLSVEDKHGFRRPVGLCEPGWTEVFYRMSSTHGSNLSDEGKIRFHLRLLLLAAYQDIDPLLTEEEYRRLNRPVRAIETALGGRFRHSTWTLPFESVTKSPGDTWANKIVSAAVLSLAKIHECSILLDLPGLPEYPNLLQPDLDPPEGLVRARQLLGLT